jgi:hypothetical protein
MYSITSRVGTIISCHCGYIEVQESSSADQVDSVMCGGALCAIYATGQRPRVLFPKKTFIVCITFTIRNLQGIGWQRRRNGATQRVVLLSGWHYSKHDQITV